MAVLTSFGILDDRMNSFEHDYKTTSSKASSCVTSSCACTYYLLDLLLMLKYGLQIRGGSTSNRGCNVIASIIRYISYIGYIGYIQYQGEQQQTSQLIESTFSVTFTKSAAYRTLDI